MKVVDAEDAVLGEDRVQPLVQLPGRGEIGAERLLGDHPRALAETVGADLLDRAFGRLRRQREIEEQLGVGVELLPSPLDLLGERVEAVADAGEAERLGEPVQRLGLGRIAAGLVDRLTGELAELLLTDRPAGGADDAEALRHQPTLREVEHPRQQLALGEVAGGAEEDDHLVLRRRHRLLLSGRHRLEPMLLRRWPPKPTAARVTTPPRSTEWSDASGATSGNRCRTR
jgi:hypothetical protein